MSQAESDARLHKVRTIPDESTYIFFKRNIPDSKFTANNIEEGRNLILKRLKFMQEYWTAERILSYFDYDVSTEYAMNFFNSTQYLINEVFVDNASQLMTVCMVATLFSDVGIQISMFLAYIIWSEYVSEAYCAQWMCCNDMHECWKRIVIHFLFEDWSKA